MFLLLLNATVFNAIWGSSVHLLFQASVIAVMAVVFIVTRPYLNTSENIAFAVIMLTAAARTATPLLLHYGLSSFVDPLAYAVVAFLGLFVLCIVFIGVRALYWRCRPQRRFSAYETVTGTAFPHPNFCCLLTAN